MKKSVLILWLSMVSASHAQPGPSHHPPFGFIFAADSAQTGQVTVEQWHDFLATLPLDRDGDLDLEALHELLEAQRPNDQDGRRKRSPTHTQYEGKRGDRGMRYPGDPNKNSKPQLHPLDLDQDGHVAVEDLLALFNALDENQDGVVFSDELPPPPKRWRRL